MAWYEMLGYDELLDELRKVEDMHDHVCRYFEDMYEELQDAQENGQRAKGYSKGISNQMLSAMERGRILSDRWLELADEILRRRGL